MRSVAKEYGWSDYQVVEKTVSVLRVETLAAYAGTYEIDGERAEVALEGTHLLVKAASLGPEARELFPESEANFFLLTSPTLLSFTRENAAGVSLEVTVNGRKTKGARISL
jgi:hypothetical protein